MTMQDRDHKTATRDPHTMVGVLGAWDPMPP